MAERWSDMDLRLLGSISVFTQQLMSRAEECLEPLGPTSRQWCSLAVFDKQFAGSSPSISEATTVSGGSRQNVAQDSREAVGSR